MARDESPEDTLSATALQDYDLCPRKWAWRKLDGVPKESNPSAEFGKAVHWQIERWLKEAVPFDLTTEAGECALACLHLLPNPKTPGMGVENSFILEGWGHRFYGFKDVEFSNVRPPVVWDHKTSTNPKRWGLTAETLPDNIQAALYATHAMVKAGSDECDLVWNYLKSKRPYKNTPIRVRVNRARIEPTLAKIRQLAGEMVLIRDSGLKALDLPFNPEACEAFGGCAYRSLCNLSADDRMKAIMSTAAGSVSEDAKKKLLARLEEKKNGGGGAGSDVNPPPDGGFTLPAGGQLSPDGKQYWAPGMAAWEPVPAAPPPPPAPPPLPASGPPPLPGGAPPWTLPAGGQLSPDGKQFWAPGMTGWEPVPAASPAGPPPLPGGAPPLPASGPPPLPGTSVPDAPPKKGKGGRPKGSKNKPAEGGDRLEDVSVSDLFRALADRFESDDD